MSKERLTPKQKEIVGYMEAGAKIEMDSESKLVVWTGASDVFVDRDTLESLLRKGRIEACRWQLKENDE